MATEHAAVDTYAGFAGRSPALSAVWLFPRRIETITLRVLLQRTSYSWDVFSGLPRDFRADLNPAIQMVHPSAQRLAVLAGMPTKEYWSEGLGQTLGFACLIDHDLAVFVEDIHNKVFLISLPVPRMTDIDLQNVMSTFRLRPDDIDWVNPYRWGDP